MDYALPSGHVLELAEQSENKTLNVFSQVYRRMEPLSRMLIHQLYTEIIKYVEAFTPESVNKNSYLTGASSSSPSSSQPFEVHV